MKINYNSSGRLFILKHVIMKGQRAFLVSDHFHMFKKEELASGFMVR